MSNRRSVKLTGLALLTGLVATACAGPKAPFDVGTRAAPISLVLGELKAVQEAPIGPISSPPAPERMPYYELPEYVGGGTYPFPTLPPMPVRPCPRLDPLAAVRAVGRVVAAPPVKASYPYRAQVLDLYPGKLFAFKGNSTWTIESGPVDPQTGAYDVTYTMKLGAATTKRVLRTLPHDIGAEPGAEPTDRTNPNIVIEEVNRRLVDRGVAPIPRTAPNPAGYGLAGIYLVSQESDGVVFTPETPIALLQLRQLRGLSDQETADANSITSAGVDPETGAAMAFRSTVTSEQNLINACGAPVQTVQVALTSPNAPAVQAPDNPAKPLLPTDAAVYTQRANSPDPTKPRSHVLLFTEKIDFALQFGGLVVNDETNVGVLRGFQVDTENPPTPPSAITAEAILGSFLAWYAKHMIFKQSIFTINEQPIYSKAS